MKCMTEHSHLKARILISFGQVLESSGCRADSAPGLFLFGLPDKNSFTFLKGKTSVEYGI